MNAIFPGFSFVNWTILATNPRSFSSSATGTTKGWAAPSGWLCQRYMRLSCRFQVAPASAGTSSCNWSVLKRFLTFVFAQMCVMDMFNSKSLFERWTSDISNKFAGIALEFEETWETDPWSMVGHHASCCGLTRDHQNHCGEAIPGAWNIWMAMSTVTWYAGGHSHDYKDLQ